MSEWKECKIGSTGRVITGKTPSKDNPEDWGDDVLFITPSDYKNYRKKAYSSIRMLSAIGAERQKTRLLPPFSILVTCIGSDMGKSVVNTVPCVTNQQINAIIPDNSEVNEDYLYYLTIDLYETFRSLGGDGTAVPILNKTDFEKIEILLPPLPEQKAIASVLSSLDDKIDLLHRQNKTLEAMAETLFRQWFVEEADEGWEEGKLVNYITVVDNRGKTPPIDEIETAYPLIEANALNGDSRLINYSVIKKYISQDTFYNWFRDKLVKYDTVITTVGANIGAMAMYVIESGNIAQNIIGLSASKISPFYLYQLLKYRKNEIFQMDIGGVQPSIKVPHLLSLEISIPSNDLQKEFDNQVLRFITKMEINYNQIRTLEKLRDTLLPKLMNGEVRVKNGE